MQSTTSPAVELLRRRGEQIESFLREAMDGRTDIPSRLRTAIEYSLLSGGKRLRPTLVLECHAVCGLKSESSGSGASLSDRSALAAAAAVELIHTFSLVHDDLPAMDDDDLRRGRPTSHRAFDEATAILAGDAMVMLAFELLAEHSDPPLAPALVRELARAAGPEGMIGGQSLDIATQHRAVELHELEQLHRMKTGALLTAACRMGAVTAGADETQLAAVTRFGRHLGLAFQIVDDLLDVTASTEQLGKGAGKDSGRGKNTYPGLLGIDPARQKAQVEFGAANRALESFGQSGENLRTLARFVVERAR